MSEVKTVDIRGLLDTYDFPFTLPSGGELKIKPITTGQMKKILAYENESDPFTIEEALDKLISDCVLTEGFDINNLYLQDRFALLLEIRKVTKGDTYQFNWKCPKCRVENIGNIRLSQLPVKTLVRNGDNVIPINDNLKFEVDFPTRADQKDAVRRVVRKGMPPTVQQVEVQTGTFANCVKKVHTPEGVFEDIPFEDKVYVLDNTTSENFKKFSKWFEDNDFGVKFEERLTCMTCTHEEKIDIPLSDFFV